MVRRGRHLGLSLVTPMNDDGILRGHWSSLLGAHVPDLDRIYSSSGRVFPERDRVLRAFSATPHEQVRVVLLGQDPYDTAGRADGLAFSQHGMIAKDSALHRIFLNLERDPEVSFSRPIRGDLTKWAHEGVLLLNAALTVVEDTAGSHLAIWKPFTRAVLRSLSDPSRKIVFILLGGDAVKLALPALKSVPIDRIVRAAHPMAGFPGNERPFHSAHVFSETNLALRPGDPVDWSL
jgi:uracil-DNA glycosylase